MSEAAETSLLPFPALNGRYAALDPDKLRGGYYTSSGVARWLCSWAVRGADDHVLEPSCGAGSFLRATAERLAELGSTPARIKQQVVGIEILKQEAEAAAQTLTRAAGGRTKVGVINDDFFSWCLRHEDLSFDCVVGNPPFIRYQSFPEPARSRAMRIMERAGLRPNRLTNIWVPFVVASAARLREGGRLAMVLPAELLQVTYAAQLRSFLVDRFQSIDIVACNELFFDNAEQEVVLLLADDALDSPSAGNKCRVTMTESPAVKAVTERKPAAVLAKSSPKVVQHDSEKWLKYFLSNRDIGFMRALRASGRAVPLSKHASVDVGVVTGKNAFFVLSKGQVDEHELRDYAIPLIGRSSQLRGALLTESEWRGLAAADERVFLFSVPSSINGELSAAGKRYVRHGEAQQFDAGYKCSIRTPWYSVPSIWNPDCFFFRQIYDFPRLVVNRAGATSTDTIHRLRCSAPAAQVAASVYTHLTAASAEIEGRSYGGGVLELEPTEAERLLMPAILTHGLPIEECDRLIRQGRLADVLGENDRLILREGMGLSERECASLMRIWQRMRDRRMKRRRGSKGRAKARSGRE